MNYFAHLEKYITFSSTLSLTLLACSSTGLAAETVRIQESRAGFCGVDGSVDKDNGGYTGSGFANTDNSRDKAVVWSINGSSGTYTFTWRYANGSTSNRSGAVLVNGRRLSTEDFAGTGKWTSWSTTSMRTQLNGGPMTVSLVANQGAGLANIDYLEVEGPKVRTAAKCDGLEPEPEPEPKPEPKPEPDPEPEDGVILPQNGNPAQARYNRAKTAWPTSRADIILSHQFDNGGWPKNQDYDSRGSGGSGKGKATFDNGATVTEIVYMAEVYQKTGRRKYLDSVRKAMDYILDAQYSSGGWPQFYPLRGGYSNHVTFNDNAMSRTLTVLHNAERQKAPFNNGIFSNAKRREMKRAIDKGVEYILKAQWKQNGKLTVWCAQHGKSDYRPKAARAYELESLSGSESVEVIGFLMTQRQTSKIKKAVKAAIAWFRSPDTILENYVYDRSSSEKIVYKPGGRMWYRFYDLRTNRGFFSDRDGGKYYDIMDISKERREGYGWGGNYGEKIIKYAKKVGY